MGLPKLLKRWSGRRGSNPRRPAWEAGILPLNYSRLPSNCFPAHFTTTSTYHNEAQPSTGIGVRGETAGAVEATRHFDNPVSSQPGRQMGNLIFARSHRY